MIPYTVERRPDTRLSNVAMGIWLFLASEVMLFGALFSSYALLRVSAPAWPSGRDLFNLPLGLLNTLVLLAGSAAIYRARSSVSEKQPLLVWISAAAAVVFLAVKAVEYSGEIAAGLLPRTSMPLAMYYLLTGTHALHVLAGLIANVWAATGLRRVGAAMTAGRIHALSLYWIFVDVIWLVILSLVYLS